MPALCKGGLWASCCSDACPTQEDERQGCECSTCLEVCEAVAVAATVSTAVDCATPLNQLAVPHGASAVVARSHFHDLGGVSLKIPFPEGDRPLLI